MIGRIVAGLFAGLLFLVIVAILVIAVQSRNYVMYHLPCADPLMRAMPAKDVPLRCLGGNLK